MKQDTKQFFELASEIRQKFKPLIDSGVKVNDLILAHYQQATGQTDFRTFKAWKESGFSVQKGQKGFKIFSRPSNALKEERGEIPSQEEGTRFFLATIFHAGQVAPIKSEN